MKKHPTLPILVSKDGNTVFNIKSNKAHSIYKWAKGYRAFKFDNIAQLMHRIVAETYLENPNNFPIVHHKDHNKANNNVSNLEWSTRRNNTKQAYDAGIFEGSGVGKKRTVDYDKIYDMFNKGNFNKTEIAQKVGVSPTQIGRILKSFDGNQ